MSSPQKTHLHDRNYAGNFGKPHTIRGTKQENLAFDSPRQGAIKSATDVGFCIIEVHDADETRSSDCRFLEADDAFERLTNLKDAAGQWMGDLALAHTQQWLETYAQVVRDGKSVRFVQDTGVFGEQRLEIHAFRIGDAPSRQIALLFSDITAAFDAAVRREALLELSDKLSNLERIDDMALIAAEVAGRALKATSAGYGAMDVDIDGITVTRDWAAPGIASIAGHYKMQDFGDYIVQLKKGTDVVIADVRLDPRTFATASVLEAVGGRAFVNLPMMEHGQMVAIFFVLSSSVRIWTPQELDFIRDVAQRTRSAIERRRAEENLRLLTSSLEAQVAKRTHERNSLWQLTDDLMLVAQGDGIVLDANPAWKQVLGWDVEQLTSRRFFDLVHPDDLPSTLIAASAISNVGQSFSKFQNRYRRIDGSYRWISWTASAANTLIVAVGRDITEDKEIASALEQAESALRQSQKMEAVGQLTGGLAHDFNNLLAGIMGNLEFLQRKLARGHLDDLDRYLNAAQASGRRAASLTQRLLAFSRRQTLDPKPTDVNRLVLGLQDLLNRTVGATVEIEVVGAAGLWTTCIDAGQLENAILNLCINGRDAMPQGGKLTIETANKWIDDRTAKERDMLPGQYISVCVTDTGTGMTPATAQRAFEPFYTTKPMGQGTGLGLSMIYGFAQQSGGQVRIYSELGQGTTVCVYLPRFYGDAVDAVEPAGTVQARPGAQTVLVVEDEAPIRSLIGELLEDLGYTVLEAADGASGLKLLRSGVNIELLITDVGLPNGMNGRQVADAARALKVGLKVLFITGFAENAAVGNGYLEPGMELLTKPFTLDALVAKVEDMLTRP